MCDMRSDMAELLGPQQWRVWCILRDGNPHGIDMLYRQARPMRAYDNTSRRQRQMALGGIICDINVILDEHGWGKLIVPGGPRGTYQLRKLSA